MTDAERRMDHPQRAALNDEVHARPPDRLPSPCAVSYLAHLGERTDPAASWRLLAELCEVFGLSPPDRDAKHYTANAGPFRLRWERHTEFARYAITVDEPTEAPFTHPPIELLPADWLAKLEGSVITAMHVRVVSEHEPQFSLRAVARRFFNDNVLVGSQIAGGAAIALTDFRIHDDGFSRLLNKKYGIQDVK